MYRTETSGETSQTYPALARVPGDLFGICVAGISGSLYRAGDTGHEFTIMSVAKPFVFALVCDVLGDEHVRQEVGVAGRDLALSDEVYASASATNHRNRAIANYLAS